MKTPLKDTTSRTLPLQFFAGLLALVLGLGLGSALSGCSAIEEFVDSFHGTVDPAAISPDDAPDELPTDEETIPADYYLVGGFDLARIDAAADVRQICIASGYGEHDCHVVFAERTQDGWKCIVDTDGHVGWGGITTNAYDGSLATPEGVYGLGFAFGINENPGTRMEYRLVDENDYWVGDQNSDYYNQWVDVSETGQVWEDDTYTEHLIDFTIPYAYSIFIQYNWPVQADLPQNCAIFLHCIGNVATAGCVSIPEEDMVTILRAIDPEGAVIVIANGDDVYNY